MSKSQLGIGVMLQVLGGNESSVKAYVKSLDKEISSLECNEISLIIKFTDNSGISFRDEGQSCCEHRYMNCDDDLSVYIGSKFLRAELLPVQYDDEEYGAHEIQFLKIETSNGWFKVSNHNSHNGYYGGFAIRAHEL